MAIMNLKPIPSKWKGTSSEPNLQIWLQDVSHPGWFGKILGKLRDRLPNINWFCSDFWRFNSIRAWWWCCYEVWADYDQQTRPVKVKLHQKHDPELRLRWNDDLVGGFKYFIFLPTTWGDDPVWPLFFRWVVQPPPSDKQLDQMICLIEMDSNLASKRNYQKQSLPCWKRMGDVWVLFTWRTIRLKRIDANAWMIGNFRAKSSRF